MLASSHSHDYTLGTEALSEKRTLWVVLLTGLTMVVEIAAGYFYNSVALLADGWHMSTHALALAVSVFAYRFSRKNKDNPLYTFGTGKVNLLGSFASAVILALVAIYIFVESFTGLFQQKPIQYNEALIVAVVGLIVNAVSILLLNVPHHHVHDEPHNHSHDHNHQAALAHVISDTLTSLLAIVALLGAKYFGWNWLDPLVGILGAYFVARWSYKLIQSTAPLLVDKTANEQDLLEVKALVEKHQGAALLDLHVWQLTPKAKAVVISVKGLEKNDVIMLRHGLTKKGFKHITLENNI